MSREEYIDKFGAIGYTNLTYHKCKLCKRTLKAAVIVITNHLKKTHGLTFQEYRLRQGHSYPLTNATRTLPRIKKSFGENLDFENNR